MSRSTPSMATYLEVGPVRKPRPSPVRPRSKRDEQLSTDISDPTNLFWFKVQPQDDNFEKTEFVIVYKRRMSRVAFKKLATFLYNLYQKGFELDASYFPDDDNIIFIRIFAPDKVAFHFAEIFSIELACNRVGYRVKPTVPSKCMGNALTLPSYEGPVISRASDSLRDARPSGITSAEKGLIIFKVLQRNSFGDNAYDNGVDKLRRSEIIQTYFPVHDGSFEWTDEGPLNDRQLLAQFWSRPGCWYKQQPLDLIEKYYGPENGLYFAWLGFYNKMLIPAATMGTLIFILGSAIIPYESASRTTEICESDLYLCPDCLVENCHFEPLKNSCFFSRLLILFDNYLVIAFAAVMSIWATVFMELWRRQEAMLQIRWNLRSVEDDYTMRPEFEESAKHFRTSPITRRREPYVPKKVMCCRYAVTSATILLLVFLMVLGILAVLIYVKTVSVILKRHQGDKGFFQLVPPLTGSLMSIIFILVFEMIYRKIALWLTQIENPRTQFEFDNSITYKCYAIAFVNYYCVILYIAFLKARFYTYPGDEDMWTTLGGIRSDLCNASGCIVELGIQLVFVLLAKNLLMTAKQFIVPQILILFNKLRKKKKTVKFTFQWEEDYMLNKMDRYYMMEQYMSMTIQYGFVIFFVAAFPLAPLFALFNNLIELRVDAYNLNRAYRRPIAFKIPNIAAWNGILEGMTYIGVATNAFVIAFTSEFVDRLIYRITVDAELDGYTQYMLSAYNVSEFSIRYDNPSNISLCYYPGKRYPPDHENRYELKGAHWFSLTIKFLTVVVFEHVIMVITGLVAYIIPDIPFSVKEHVNYQKDVLKKMKLQRVRDDYMRSQHRLRNEYFDE